jgi:Skp family chaperone for outer membrane proteins
MQKVINQLELTGSVNEDTIVTAIERIKTQKEEAEELAAKYKAEKEELETKFKAELDELQKKYDQLEQETKEAEEEKLEAEEAEKEEKCKNMLAGFVKTGRIKEDALPAWMETVQLVGIDKVKNMIEGLPLSKKAEVISLEELPETDEMPTTVVNYMAKIQAKNKQQA